MATPQQPLLASGVGARQDQRHWKWPSIAPPARAAEPYTVEHWALIAQPRSIGLTLYASKWQQWSRTGATARPGIRARYEDIASNGHKYIAWRQEQSLSLAVHGGAVHQQICAVVTVVDCPRRTFDPDCTPMDQPIPLNDTCRQTVLWPKTWGEHQGKASSHIINKASRDRHADNTAPTSAPSTRANASQQCPSLRAFSYDPHSYVATRRGEQGDQNGFFRAVLTCSVRSDEGNARPGMTARARTAVWSQTVTTIWPPGTVAVLPVGPNATASGDFSDYPWRVNRAHVVTMTSNVPSAAVLKRNGTLFTGKADTTSFNPLSCGAPIPLYPESSASKLVFLDDTSCIASRTCRPDVGSSTNASSPQYRQAVDDYVASDIAQLFPTGMVGCALSYSLDFDALNTDILPVDMPLTQNGAGFSLGGWSRAWYDEKQQYWPAQAGRWNESDAAAHRSSVQYIPASMLKRASRSLVKDGTVPTPIFSDAAIHGPYAVYRGPVPHRMLPPSPNATLPPINRGRWACARTAPQGYFQERPYCLAMCDDPSHIAVDVGLERDAGLAAVGVGAGAAGASRDGWALVASQARHWYSYWLGYPGLVQDERVYGNDRLAQVPALGSVHPVVTGLSGPSYGNASNSGSPLPLPSMSCEPDDDRLWHRSWSRSSRWAQRLPVSRGHVQFDLAFDASTWPAAVPLSRTSPWQPPGLQWPNPSKQQLEWLLADLEMDLGDQTGCTGHEQQWCRWHVQLVGVSTGAASGVRDECNSNLEANGWCRELPMRITVLAQPVLSKQHGIEPQIGSSKQQHDTPQRSMTTGSLLQRVARAMRGGPEAGLAGVWLLAVDAKSVSLQIHLPGLPVFTPTEDYDTLGSTQVTVVSAKVWITLPVVITSIAVVSFGAVGLAFSVCHRSGRRSAATTMAVLLACTQAQYWVLAAALTIAALQVPGYVLFVALFASAMIRCVVLGLALVRSGQLDYRRRMQARILANQPLHPDDPINRLYEPTPVDVVEVLGLSQLSTSQTESTATADPSVDTSPGGINVPLDARYTQRGSSSKASNGTKAPVLRDSYGRQLARMVTIQSVGSKGEDESSSSMRLQPGHHSESVSHALPSSPPVGGFNLSSGEAYLASGTTTREDQANPRGECAGQSSQVAQAGDTHSHEIVADGDQMQCCCCLAIVVQTKAALDDVQQLWRLSNMSVSVQGICIVLGMFRWELIQLLSMATAGADAQSEDESMYEALLHGRASDGERDPGIAATNDSGLTTNVAGIRLQLPELWSESEGGTVAAAGLTTRSDNSARISPASAEPLPKRGQYTPGRARSHYLALMNSFEVGAVLVCLAWATLCLFGVCPTDACIVVRVNSGQWRDLLQTPWPLLVWDRLVVAGIPAAAAVLLTVASWCVVAV